MNRIRTVCQISLSVTFVLATCWGVRGQDQTDGVERRKDPKVVFVTIDGLRWQDVFRGAETKLISRDRGGVRDVPGVMARFSTDQPSTARERLMPFLWGVVEDKGQLWGNLDRQSEGRCANGRYFSYPGYSELIVGRVDPAIDSNAKKPNPNLNVFEWLKGQSDFKDSIAMVGSWDVLPYVLNAERSGIPANSGWQEIQAKDAEAQEINRLQQDLPRVWPGVRYDHVTFRAALRTLRTRQPSVMWIAFGETDDWAHDGRYDLYLDAAYRTDRYLKLIWDELQAIEAYRGVTTMIITVDHGRGEGAEDWKSHSASIAGSEHIWLAAIGPAIPALGEREGVRFEQRQVAATIAWALGQDFTESDPKVAQPIDFSGAANSIDE